MVNPTRGESPGLLPAGPPSAGKLRSRIFNLGAALLTRVLGTADGRAVGDMALRELTLTLRSRAWHRFLGMWLLAATAILLLPLLYRLETGRWSQPSDAEWFAICGYGLQFSVAFAMAQWCIRRLRRDLYSDRLEELMLTRCSAADIAMGEALAAAVASLWIVAAALPYCLFLSAMAGKGLETALRLMLSLAPAGSLGVWFGMGWGMAFTLRKPAAIFPMTGWWVMGPFVPLWIAWSFLCFLTLLWAGMGLFPGSLVIMERCLALLQWGMQQILRHWNPFLTVPASADLWQSTWITDWLVLMGITTFMMRKSMDAIQVALVSLPERETVRGQVDFWVHHDVHHFTQYGEEKRREVRYRDGGNPIAAFDVALGHRVFLHPFLWAVVIMAYLFLLGWSLLVPEYGLGTGIVAVLLPATGALLLMSGGVAVSFGWERDQHRWPALAVLPVEDYRIALGKIKGVVRPTLWVGLIASVTALVLGWRGTLPMQSALWMSLHVLTFPVALAFVSATLALTTPTLGEALYRWAFLGALPTLASVLPYPIGGEAGFALPFTPPLLVLLVVLEGPTPDLIRSCWVSLILQILGSLTALVILSRGLRHWTVGEKD